MAASISRSNSRPQEHRTVLTDKLIFSGKGCPQKEQVCEVFAGLTSTTILPASAALENSRSVDIIAHINKSGNNTRLILSD